MDRDSVCLSLKKPCTVDDVLFFLCMILISGCFMMIKSRKFNLHRYRFIKEKKFYQTAFVSNDRLMCMTLMNLRHERNVVERTTIVGFSEFNKIV